MSDKVDEFDLREPENSLDLDNGVALGYLLKVRREWQNCSVIQTELVWTQTRRSYYGVGAVLRESFLNIYISDLVSSSPRAAIKTEHHGSHDMPSGYCRNSAGRRAHGAKR